MAISSGYYDPYEKRFGYNNMQREELYWHQLQQQVQQRQAKEVEEDLKRINLGKEKAAKDRTYTNRLLLLLD